MPGDTDATYLAVTASAQTIDGFEKVTGLDTIRFVQDVRLGTTLRGEFGATVRDEAGRGTEVQPTLAADLRTAHRLTSSAYVSAGLSGRARVFAGEAVGWRSAVDLRAYELSLPDQTLAFSARLTSADESQDLPVQLTLGEDSGLRGYPRRELVGDQVLRLNLEDRWDTGSSSAPSTSAPSPSRISAGSASAGRAWARPSAPWAWAFASARPSSSAAGSSASICPSPSTSATA